jgi:cytoskeletal protein CcmA (bactofilin family)
MDHISKKTDNALFAFNLITEGNCVKGDILSKGDIRINGEVIGSVKSEGKIVVGPKAFIKGSIEAVELIIEGRIKGIVHVKKRVYIKSMAKLLGELSCQELVLELGAAYNGSCCIEGV